MTVNGFKVVNEYLQQAGKNAINMAKKKRRRVVVKKMPPEPTLAERLEAQRQRIFMAMGIVSCAWYASDSMLFGEPNLVDGLKAAEEILSEVAEALDELIPDKPVDDQSPVGL